MDEQPRYPDLSEYGNTQPTGYMPSAPSYGSTSQYSNLAKINTSSMITGYCRICSLPLIVGITIIYPACGHPYHYHCGRLWFSRCQDACQVCPSEYGMPPEILESRVAEENVVHEEVSREQEDEITTRRREVEQRLGLQGSNRQFITNTGRHRPDVTTEDKKIKSTLSFAQKLAIMGPDFIKKDTVIDLEFLLKKGCTLFGLLEKGIDLTSIYKEFKIESWRDLLELQPNCLTLSQLESNELQKLVTLYQVEYTHLRDDLGIDLLSLAEDITRDPLILCGLGLSFETMYSEGLDLYTMSAFGLPIAAWVDFLGFQKDHLFLMRIDKYTCQDLGWPIKEVCEIFNLSDEEKKLLKVDQPKPVVQPKAQYYPKPIPKRQETRPEVRMDVPPVVSSIQRPMPVSGPRSHGSRNKISLFNT